MRGRGCMQAKRFLLLLVHARYMHIQDLGGGGGIMVCQYVACQ